MTQYVCIQGVCSGKPFVTNRLHKIEGHLSSKHLDYYPYICAICGENGQEICAPSMNGIQLHNQMHHRGQMEKVKICLDEEKQEELLQLIETCTQPADVATVITSPSQVHENGSVATEPANEIVISSTNSESPNRIQGRIVNLNVQTSNAAANTPPPAAEQATDLVDNSSVPTVTQPVAVEKTPAAAQKTSSKPRELVDKKGADAPRLGRTPKTVRSSPTNSRVVTRIGSLKRSFKTKMFRPHEFSPRRSNRTLCSSVYSTRSKQPKTKLTADTPRKSIVSSKKLSFLSRRRIDDKPVKRHDQHKKDTKSPERSSNSSNCSNFKKCMKCKGNINAASDGLRKHVIGFHMDARCLKCNLCDFHGKWHNGVWSHQNTKHGVRGAVQEDPVYTAGIDDACEICFGLGTTDWFSCDTCAFRSVTPRGLRTHKSRIHSGKQSSNSSTDVISTKNSRGHLKRCRLCNENVSKLGCGLYSHVVGKHMAHPCFACNFCDFHSKWKPIVWKHQKEAHDSKTKRTVMVDEAYVGQISTKYTRCFGLLPTRKCGSCSFQAESTKGLRVHQMRVHHKNKTNKPITSLQVDSAEEDNSVDDSDWNDIEQSLASLTARLDEN